jgi:hypothetical protein
MRNSIFILAFILIGFTGCNNRCKSVDGPRFSEIVLIGNSNTLTLDMVADLQVKVDSSRAPQIEIIAQEGVHEKIQAINMKGDLSISMSSCVKENSEILMEASLSGLDQVVNVSAGKVSSGTLLESESFRLTNEGLGDLDFVLKSKNIIAEIKSSGDIILAGSTKKLEFLTLSSGDLRAFNLVADTILLNVIGSSVCDIYTDGILQINFYQNGFVNYRGTPKEIIVTGEGNVKDVNIE